MPEVSVIIPAYNAAKTIKRCIMSILEQSYSDLECIVVDDGSKDDTANIIKQINDPRIRYIYKENSGVSSTRNRAIKEAKGDYICFLDADDYQSEQALSLLVTAMKMHNVDLVVGSFYRVVDDKLAVKSYFKKECLLSRNEYAKRMSKKPAEYYFGVLWNKLYRRSIIEQFNIRMDESISWSEDFIFNLEYIRHIQNVYILNSPVYYYIKTQGSLVNNNNNLVARTIKMKMDVYRYYKKFLEDVFCDDEDYRSEKYILIDSASDGGAFIQSKKLGEEKIAVNENVLEGGSYLADLYRHRKVAEKFLDIVAQRNNLSLNDIYVFICIINRISLKNLDEFADYLNMDKMKIGQSLINLKYNKLIEYKLKSEEFVSLMITDYSLKVMDEIELARHEIESVIYNGLSDDEIAEYYRIREIISKNEEKFL